MNVAVVDLGTNTFNCSIVSLSRHSFSIIETFHEYPRLGEKGVAYGYITEEAIERGIASLGTIKQRIEPYHCEQVKLIGTSALRNAKNAQDFCSKARELYDFEIQIIDGEQEAEYIFLGNKLAFDWGNQTALIIDIGGGSNECIICKHNEIIWKHSFECGMQRIVSQFGLEHPLPTMLKNNIHDYLEEKFSLLTEVIKNIPIDIMIGSAGAFDVFRSIYFAQHDMVNPDTAAEEIPMKDFSEIIAFITSHGLDEIDAMKGMDLPRAPLLPIAGCIANHLIQAYHIPRVIQSSYSLKEGVIHTLLR